MRSPAIALAALAVLAGCKRPEDQAAKQRIFSPEQPTGSDARAKEPLDARKLADDPKLAERVLRMSRAEIGSRLGAHKIAAHTQFKWSMGETAPDAGSNEVALSEDTTLTQARDGDFAAQVQNDKNQGFEAVWASGDIYVRSRVGPFRKRRTDRSDPPRLREQTSAGLATFDQLAKGLKLTLRGDANHEGRRAVRYEVAGSGNAPAQPADADLPVLQWPQGGPDLDTQRRLSLWTEEKPGEVSGHLLVDAETAAPLAYELQGRFSVPQASGPSAELELAATGKTTAIGRELSVKAPAYEVEPTVPHAVKDPLRFLGKQAAAAAAAATAQDEEEGDDESEPAEPPAEKPAVEGTP